jgi:hypothetical protein
MEIDELSTLSLTNRLSSWSAGCEADVASESTRALGVHCASHSC